MYLSEHKKGYVCPDTCEHGRGRYQQKFRYHAWHGYREYIAWLMDKGTTAGAGRGAAIHPAALNDQFGVQLLIGLGTHIHARHELALGLAARCRRLDVVKFLVEVSRADIHARHERALGWAVVSNALDIVKYLLRRGANIHAVEDRSAVWASESGHLKLLKFLVLHGANIHAGDERAVGWAARRGHLNVVKYLVQTCSANINAMHSHPLRWAARNGFLDVVEYLVSCGAKYHADNNGARKLAAKHGHRDIEVYLMNLDVICK